MIRPRLCCRLFPYTTLFRSYQWLKVHYSSLFGKHSIRNFENNTVQDTLCFHKGMRSHLDKGSCRSEEHTSELQSRGHLVCRLLLEKKNRDHHALHVRYQLLV